MSGQTDQPNQPITTADLDSAIREMWAKRQEYDRLNEKTKACGAECDDLEAKIIAMLEQCNKDSYLCEGTARVNRITKLSVRIPQDSVEKAKFFKWLKEKHGAEGFLAYATVNSQSLNKLYNEEFAACPEEDRADFSIDGVGSPTERVSLRVTKHVK